MRPLIIDDVARAEARRVIEHAEQHHYFPGQATPGDDPRFVAKLGTYRVVFSFTHANDLIWRHLSVSVPGRKYPNPAAVFVIAQLFGFTGWDGRTIDCLPDGWFSVVREDEHCVTLGQACGHDPNVTAH